MAALLTSPIPAGCALRYCQNAKDNKYFGMGLTNILSYLQTRWSWGFSVRITSRPRTAWWWSADMCELRGVETCIEWGQASPIQCITCNQYTYQPEFWCQPIKLGNEKFSSQVLVQFRRAEFNACLTRQRCWIWVGAAKCNGCRWVVQLQLSVELKRLGERDLIHSNGSVRLTLLVDNDRRGRSLSWA